MSNLDNPSAFPESTQDEPGEQVADVLRVISGPSTVRRLLIWYLITAVKLKSWSFPMAKRIVKNSVHKWISFTKDNTPKKFESCQQTDWEICLDLQKTVLRSQEAESEAEAAHDPEFKKLQARCAELETRSVELEERLAVEKDRVFALERENVEMKKELLEHTKCLGADFLQARWKNGLLVAEYYRRHSSPIKEDIDIRSGSGKKLRSFSTVFRARF